MKGKITLRIRKRKITESNKYKDKWDEIDQLTLECYQKNYFIMYSRKFGQRLMITRDEIAFVKALNRFHHDGDYNILMYGKGKNRGYRRFWDGVISTEGTFLRRTEARNSISSYSTLYSEAIYTESFVRRYMKTKRPGVWYTL